MLIFEYAVGYLLFGFMCVASALTVERFRNCVFEEWGRMETGGDGIGRRVSFVFSLSMVFIFAALVWPLFLVPSSTRAFVDRAVRINRHLFPENEGELAVLVDDASHPDDPCVFEWETDPDRTPWWRIENVLFTEAKSGYDGACLSGEIASMCRGATVVIINHPDTEGLQRLMKTLHATSVDVQLVRLRPEVDPDLCAAMYEAADALALFQGHHDESDARLTLRKHTMAMRWLVEEMAAHVQRRDVLLLLPPR